MSETFCAYTSMQRVFYRKAVKDKNLKCMLGFVLRNCKLVGKIVKVDGRCVAKHRVGEEFDLTLYSEKADMIHRVPSICGFLYNSIFPYLVTLQFEGAFPWEKDKDTFLAGCPDNCKVKVEIRRARG